MTSSPLQLLIFSSAESLDESFNPVAEELSDDCFPVIEIGHLEVPLDRLFGSDSLI